MKPLEKIVVSIIAAIVLMLPGLVWPASATAAREPNAVRGGFEMSGYLSVGMGWQRFGNAPVTEVANDGSYAGVLGSVIPGVQSGVPPTPGEDIAQAFAEVFEIDITKSFGDRARLAAHLWFGRPGSGTWVWPSVSIEQAYAAVTLSRSRNVEFLVGRFTTQAGYEYDEPYLNDMISWSINARSNLYPYIVTGAQLAFDIARGVRISLALDNGNVNDWNIVPSDIPSGHASLAVTWGPEEKQNIFVLTPFVGPESVNNRPLTYGANAVVSAWLTDDFEFGLEGTYHRDDSAGGPATTYAAGLLNLHYDFTDRLYGVARYAFARQFEAGNGFLNLTGAKQSIHEMNLGAGYELADGMKMKFEARTDAVVPAGGKTQWVPGVAMGLVCAF